MARKIVKSTPAATRAEIREVARQMETVTIAEDVTDGGFPDLTDLEESELAEDWETAFAVRAAMPGREGVPTIDDELDEDPHAAPRVYPAWKRGETFVFSRVLSDKTRAHWRAYALEKYGAILEEYLVHGKYVARVPVPGGPHDPRKNDN